MSTTRFETGTMGTYAGLRFSGDRLAPESLTRILGTEPRTAYRKGDVFKIVRGHEVRGRTGLWLLSSEGRVDSLDLNDHLDYLLGLVFPDGRTDKLPKLQKLMRNFQIEADVPCFWHGEHGAEPPVVRDDIRSQFARIPAAIEEDFDTD